MGVLSYDPGIRNNAKLNDGELIVPEADVPERNWPLFVLNAAAGSCCSPWLSSSSSATGHCDGHRADRVQVQSLCHGAVHCTYHRTALTYTCNHRYRFDALTFAGNKLAWRRGATWQ